MKEKENKEHVLSIRITQKEYERLLKISDINNSTLPKTARKAIKMLLMAYQEQFEETKKTDNV